MNDGFTAFREALESVERVLITTHVNPDGDAVGSSLGLRAILEAAGKRAEVVMSDPVPVKYRFMMDRPVLSVDDPSLAGLPEGERFQMAVLLDASERKRAGRVLDMFDKWLVDDAIEVNIDHHVGNNEFSDINIVDPERASSAELVLDIARELDVTLSTDAANQLFAGILTDTGRFHYSNTNTGSLNAAGELVNAGADPQFVATRIYFERSLYFYRLLGHLLGTMEMHHDGRTCVMSMSSETVSSLWPDGLVDTEGIVDFTIQIRDVDVGIFIRQTGENSYRASLRSRGDVNVRQVAEAFGGGGHENAAGCPLTGSLEEVTSQLLTELEKWLQ